MAHTLLQLRLEDSRSSLFDSQEKINDIIKRFSAPTTRSSIPLSGSLRWDDTGAALEIFQSSTSAWQTLGTGGSDFKVKVTSDDTTGDYLLNKLAAGTGITLTETNPAGDEDVTIGLDLSA